MAKIGEIIFSEMKTLFEENPETFPNPEESYETMINHFREIDVSSRGRKMEKKIYKSKEQKPKKKRPVYSTEERCIALKADGDRCSGKKYEKGENQDLCSIHNKKPPKSFWIERETEGGIEVEDKMDETIEETIEEYCNYQFETGEKKGKLCNKFTENGKELCSNHHKLVEAVKPKMTKEEEKKLKLELFGEDSEDEECHGDLYERECC